MQIVKSFDYLEHKRYSAQYKYNHIHRAQMCNEAEYNTNMCLIY